MTPEFASQLASSAETYGKASSSDLNCDLSTAEGLETVTKALEAPDMEASLREAVETFGRYEMELFALAQDELRRAGDA